MMVLSGLGSLQIAPASVAVSRPLERWSQAQICPPAMSVTARHDLPTVQKKTHMSQQTLEQLSDVRGLANLQTSIPRRFALPTAAPYG